MIICHPLKLIFVKPKQAGGTPFEIALSKFCEADCVITPLSQEGEKVRRELGYPKAQNFTDPTWPDGSKSSGAFYDHINTTDARDLIPQDIWDTYTKITIVRNPFDVLVSRYIGDKKTLNLATDFGQYAHIYRNVLLENGDIAPVEGADKPDIVLRYEHLEEDVNGLGIDGLWDVLCKIQEISQCSPETAGSVRDMYQDAPEAAEIVYAQCRPEIERFGYSAPVIGRASETDDPNSETPGFIFTLSSGRSGTSWLAKFLGANLNINSVHEPFGLDDFGTQMPEISVMRKFNEVGMDRTVREFWKNKLSKLKAPYAESNHTLCKCGLVESLAKSDIADRTKIIVLRRDLVKQCLSYINRNDFNNIGLVWQFYLSPTYRNRIVDSTMFQPMGKIGYALWYCLEMEARQTYYTLKYGDRLDFIEARLEDVTKPQGAQKLLAALGHDKPAILPEKANANKMQSDPRLEAEIRTFLTNQNFNPHEVATSYMEQGRRLDQPPLIRAA